MKNLFIIGLIILVSAQCAFDKIVFESETNSAILFWIGIYLPLLLFTVNEIFRRRDRNTIIFYFGVCCYFIYDIINQLSFINLPYDEYENNVYAMIPSYEFGLYISALVILNTILFERKKFKILANKILWGKF